MPSEMLFEIEDVVMQDGGLALNRVTSKGETWLLKRADGEPFSANSLQLQQKLFAELALTRRYLLGVPNLSVPVHAFASDSSLCLIYEPCACIVPDIQRKWASAGMAWPIADIKRLAWQLCSAVDAMHQRRVSHLALRPQVRCRSKWIDLLLAKK